MDVVPAWPVHEHEVLLVPFRRCVTVHLRHECYRPVRSCSYIAAVRSASVWGAQAAMSPPRPVATMTSASFVVRSTSARVRRYHEVVRPAVAADAAEPTR